MLKEDISSKTEEKKNVIASNPANITSERVQSKKPTDLPSHDEHNNKTRVVSSRLKFLEKQLPKLKILLQEKESNNNVISAINGEQVAYSTSSKEFDYLDNNYVHRRAKSLKSCITSPGSPHTNKVVRFADALGLDLESVKQIMKLDEPPDLQQFGGNYEFDTEGVCRNNHESCRTLVTCFPQPAANIHFIQKVLNSKISLENCVGDGEQMAIHGTVRVANIGYHKKVILRYSPNKWLSYTNVEASYVQNSSDGATDRFSFFVQVPRYFQTGNKLHFAVMMQVHGKCYWDNNDGKNYSVECFSSI